MENSTRVSWNSMLLVSILLNLTCFYWSEGRCIEQERIALLSIKNSIAFPRGRALSDWKGDDCCQWSGVICNVSTSRVINIDLNYARQTPPLGESWYPNATLFAQFQDLEQLSLSGNQIAGWIMPQELCRLRNLRYLYLTENQLALSPPCLGNLPVLETLALDFNNLTESHSLDDLCGLTNLRFLVLSRNQLNGFPHCISNMSSLETLYIDIYNFTSSLALSELCRSRNLQSLYLGWNCLNPLAHCLRNFPFLSIQCLAVNDLKEVPPSALEGLCMFKNLQLLYIINNKLVDGSIPPCLGNLSSLQHLRLSNNQLTGYLDFCGLQNLTNLDLSWNQLTRLPRCLGNLASLTELSLGNNNLNTSTSLKELCGLRNLQSLNLRHNQLLDASIPPCLGHLIFLDLSYNQLTHNFDLCVLQNPILLDLSANQFNRIPRCLGNLTSLTYQHMDMNNLTESPALEGLCKLSDLVALTLFSNKFGGSVPLCFGQLNSLRTLDLSSNQFNMSIHWSILNNLTSIVYIDVSANNIHEMLPKDIGFLLPELNYFNMSSNSLQGSIPPSFGNMKDLRILDLSNNIFFGEIPDQLVSNATSLEYLDLSNNNLHGDMFSRNFNMVNMKALYLYANQLIGMIPRTLSNSPYLKILDIRNNSLSGAIPSWLSSLPNLNAILLKGNQFDGRIPIQLCTLQNLRILDLSHNHLTGRIPACFYNITPWKDESQTEIKLQDALPDVEFMTKTIIYSYEGIVLSLMTGIDISSNQLTGSIPLELGYLRKLRSLNLSNNNFIGQIPESFKNLEKIESLDLSFNKLNGIIPPTLLQLYFLSTFFVAHNNLSGRVPNGNQFSTFDERSYDGNPCLCGIPLKRNCSVPSIPAVRQDGEEDYDIIDNVFLFYSMMAISYILGFWGVIFLFYLNKKLRRYLEIIDEYTSYFFLGQ